MSTRRIIWLSILVLHLIVFFFLIPVDVYDDSNMFLSFTGGFLFFCCLFQLLGNYDSVYELFEKSESDEPEPAGRKLAPFAVIPSIIVVLLLLFYHLGRKDDELVANGVLTKGTVVGGESTTTTRRFRSNTTYSIRVTYQDSLRHRHTTETSVNGGEFNDLYQGAKVDVVYSKRYPRLAKAVLDLKELSKLKSIPQEKIMISHLLAILEGKVKEDSTLQYLNSINYEWVQGDEAGYYKNDKLDIAIKLFPETGQMAYVQKTNLFATDESTFEETIGEHGFKKKASNVNGEKKELYYNDTYVISKERKHVDNNRSSGMISMDGYDVFHIATIASLDE